MGKAMSRLRYRATKPFREFNIEERAHRAIMKENRPKAPRHESTASLIENAVKNMPEEVKKGLKKKDTDLLKRLKTVYVTSEDVVPEKKIASESEDRPLPTERSYIEESKYGFHEPRRVSYGKITLRLALEAISRHQEDPQNWDAKKISHEYKMDLKLTEKMLHHFRTFVVIVPENAKTKLTQDMLNAIPLQTPSLQQITAGSQSGKDPPKS